MKLQNKNLEKLLEMIKENPDLPIIPWVDSDIVADEGFSRWTASWGDCNVVEHLFCEIYGDLETLVYRDDTEELEEYLLDYDVCEESELENYISKMDWQKAIFVDIDLP